MLRHFCATQVFLVFLIIQAFPLAQQGFAQVTEGSGVPTATWNPPRPEKEQVAPEKKAEVGPPKVRIGLRLTPFKKVTTRNQDNTISERFVPLEPIRHTLRARLDKTNHFFIGEWHVETRPVSWIKKTRKYEVQLVLHRRYGAFGQLEENIGSVNLAGVLDEAEDNVHVLLGVARQRLRDKFSHPVLDVVAGFAAGSKQGAPMSKHESRNDRAAGPAQPPVNYSGSLIRGRF